MLLKEIATFFFILSWSVTSLAQNRIINQSGTDQDSLFLISYRTIQQDTIFQYSVQKDSVISFSSEFGLGLGFYALAGKNWKSQDFILSPKENTTITIDKNENISISNSKENKLHETLQRELGDINKRLSNIELLQSKAADTSLILKYDQLVTQLKQEKRDYVDSAYRNNVNSYSAYTSYSYLRKVSQSTDQTTLAFNSFNDAVLNSTIVPHIIMNYLKKHTTYDEKGFKESVDHLINSATPHQVHEFTLGYLLKLFDEVGPKIIYDYLVEKHVLEGHCSENSLISEDIYLSYLKVQIGSTLHNFKIDTTDLKTIVADQKYTVLFFWSSQCGHCEAIIPKLIENYPYFSSNGIEIVGVSLDNSFDLYEIAIKKHPWVSFCDGKSWKGPISSYLHVNRTPSFVLLDSELQIVLKPNNIDELNQFINSSD